MLIREATPDDNAELQEAQAKCPQGTTLVVSTVNTPDFFARVKAYEDYIVYVASEDNHIIGSAACAIRDAVVNEKVVQVGHHFQIFVIPDYRGKGVAKQLHEHCEGYLTQKSVAMSYAFIMEGNLPSMYRIERQGFKRHHTLVMPGLAVFRKMDASSQFKIRPVLTDELVTVADLLNDTWQGHELRETMSAERLSQFVTRTPGYTFDNLFVLEDRGEILACLGFWDWSKVTRITVERLNRRMQVFGFLSDIASYFRQMPSVPRPGETLKQMVLTPIGFKDPKHLGILLRYVNNVALRSDIGYIYCICERDHPLLTSMKGFARIDTTMYLYIKPIRENISISNKPVFLNGVDL